MESHFRSAFPLPFAMEPDSQADCLFHSRWKPQIEPVSSFHLKWKPIPELLPVFHSQWNPNSERRTPIHSQWIPHSALPVRSIHDGSRFLLPYAAPRVRPSPRQNPWDRGGATVADRSLCYTRTMKYGLPLTIMAVVLPVLGCTKLPAELLDGDDQTGIEDLRRSDSSTVDLRGAGRCFARGSALLLKDRGQFVMPLLTWGGGRYAVSFYDDHLKPNDFHGYFAFLDAQGQLDSASLRTVAPGGLAPRLAYSGTEYGMAYLRGSPGKYEVRFARISDAGELVAGSDVKLGEAGTALDIAWNPDRREWAVAWHFVTGTATTTSGVQLSRVAVSTPLAPSPPVTVSSGSKIGSFGGTGGTALLWTGSRYALIQGPPGGTRPELTEVSAEGAVIRRIAIGVAESPESARAALAYDGSGYGVVWMSNLFGKSESRFGVVGADGVYVPRSERVLGTTGIYQGEPVIAWSGQEYAIVWHEQTTGSGSQSTLHGCRVSKTGGMIQPAQTLTAHYTTWPQLTWNGCQYALAYEQIDGKPQGKATYFTDSLPTP